MPAHGSRGGEAPHGPPGPAPARDGAHWGSCHPSLPAAAPPRRAPAGCTQLGRDIKGTGKGSWDPLGGVTSRAAPALPAPNCRASWGTRGSPAKPRAASERALARTGCKGLTAGTRTAPGGFQPRASRATESRAQAAAGSCHLEVAVSPSRPLPRAVRHLSRLTAAPGGPSQGAGSPTHRKPPPSLLREVPATLGVRQPPQNQHLGVAVETGTKGRRCSRASCKHLGHLLPGREVPAVPRALSRRQDGLSTEAGARRCRSLPPRSQSGGSLTKAALSRLHKGVILGAPEGTRSHRLF